MKSKLLLAYLKIQPLLLGIVSIGLLLIGMYYQQRNRITSNTPWIVQDVVSGNFLITSRKHKEFKVKLCGISANSDESRKYLRSHRTSEPLAIK